MLVESAPLLPTPSAQRKDEGLLRKLSLKRKLDSFKDPFQQAVLCYPSPPMSGPSSPSRLFPDLYLVSTTEQQAGAVISSTSHSTIPSAPPITYPLLQPSSIQPYHGQQAITTSYPEQVIAPQPAWAGRASATFSQTSVTGAQPGPSSPASAGPPGSRGGRKSKAHVASACINCKRAHLSCDVQRPCVRCVASGKQDTCYDVQHKKRGRPRLRDEGEFKVEQIQSYTGTLEAGPTVQAPTPARPVAQTRRRRAESFRSLQSQLSEASSGYGPSIPGYASQSAMQRPMSSIMPPPPGSSPTGPEIPTALLDLDLVVLRANRSFQQIMLDGQDARGRRIGDLAAPTDGKSFQAIRNQLRAEREHREPSYLPPILQTGEDPLQAVSASAIDQLTQGTADRTYTWTQTQLGPAAQVFPARVRLAKAATYFVVVTLPSFRPVQQAPPALPVAPTYGTPFMMGPPATTPVSYFPQQRPPVASAPPVMYYSPEGASAPLQQVMQGQVPATRTYPPPQPPMPYQQPYHQQFQSAAPPTPRLSIAEPPTVGSPFTPRSAPRESAQLAPATTILIPPLMSGPAGPSSSQQRAPAAQQGSSSEEDSEGRRLRSARKRRRMGIDEVLQR